MKRTVIFRDAEKHRVSVTFETEQRDYAKMDWDTLEQIDSYKTLSMSGEIGSSFLGQVCDHIKPATKNQRKLVAMWKDLHLNDAMAGTKAQEEYLNSAAFKKAIEQFDRFFERSSMWKKFVEGLESSLYGKRFRVRVNRGRGHEVFVEIGKEGNVKRTASFTQELTADDMEYAKEQFRKFFQEEKEKLFRKVLPSCAREFFDTYDAGDGRELEAVIRVDELEKLFEKLYDPNTLKLSNRARGSYEFKSLLLKLAGLFKDRGYKYGHGWLLKPLPEDIDDRIKELCDAIESENVDLAEQSARELETTESGDVDWAKDLSELDGSDDAKYLKALQNAMDIDDFMSRIALALGKALGESAAGIVDYFSEEDMGCCKYSFGADYYYVGEIDALETEAKDVMESSYRGIWVEAVTSGRTNDSFDAWIDDVIANDGFASVLDRYDGEGMSAKVDGRTYYICRP